MLELLINLTCLTIVVIGDIHVGVGRVVGVAVMIEVGVGVSVGMSVEVPVGVMVSGICVEKVSEWVKG